MSDASNDRSGSKPPRTMFSLGRPGNRATGDEQVAEPVEPAEEADSTVLVDSGYLCGSCEHPLPVGAAFCGECGTPVLGTIPDPGETVVDEKSPLTGLEVPNDPAHVHDGAAGVEPAVDAPVDAPVDAETPPPGVEMRPPGYMPPAAVLYGEANTQPEPLPDPSGSWGITTPTYGTTDTPVVDPGVDPAVVPAAVDASAADATTADPAIAVPPGEPVADPADPYATAPAADPYAAAPLGADVAAPATVAAGYVAPAPLAAAPPGVPTPVPSPVAGSAHQAPKSKTPLILGIAAAIVVVLIIGGVVIAMAGKSDNSVQTAGKATTPSTQAGKGQPSTSAAPQPTTTIDAPTSTAAAPETTAAPDTTSAPNTTAAPVTVAPTVAPTTPAPTNPPTTPAPTPGSISVSGLPGSIGKGEAVQLTLTNSGQQPASYALSVTNGSGTVSPGSGQVPAGGSTTVVLTPGNGYEGQLSIGGAVQGQPGNRYSASTFVRTN